MVSADGKHGLVCETIDQGVSSWYNAQNVISNPSNHSANGQNFTDWRVPTRYELAQMYSIKTGIEAFGSGSNVSAPANYNNAIYQNLPSTQKVRIANGTTDTQSDDML